MITQANDSDVEKIYKFARSLGQGTFATVKLATHNIEKSKWAVKIIKRSALSSDDEESLKMEIKILNALHHPNIVSVKEVFYAKTNVYLVMDLMTGGELFDRIVMKDHYSEQEAKAALLQIVGAIKYCHDNHIVHRDLKPENILYADTTDESLLKVADFGLATIVHPNQLMTVACGTPGYVAPEILRGQAYGKEVDTWSIGVILYILLCGFPPFYDDNNKKLFAQIVNAQYTFPDPYWTQVSAEAKELVSLLLVIDRTKRLTCDQILKHPWVGEGGKTEKLEFFQENLAQYNAKRKLKGAIRAVQMTNMLRSVSSLRGASARGFSADSTDVGDDGIARAKSLAHLNSPSASSDGMIHSASSDAVGTSKNDTNTATNTASEAPVMASIAESS